MFKHSTSNIQAFQKLLFSIAYKIIGEVAPCEDIVQDSLAIYVSKAQKKGLNHIENLEGYLAKTVTNKCINHLKRNKQKRENYVGVWLPEPIFDQKYLDAKIDIGYGLTFLLSRFTPKERAIFILKKAFDFSFGDISATLDLKEASCRKTYQRLKPKLEKKTKKNSIDTEHRNKLLEAFKSVDKKDGLNQLIRILKEDIIIYSDGGGKVSAATKPIVGLVNCTKFLQGLFKKRGAELQLDFEIINGEPAMLLFAKSGALDTAVQFTIFEGKVKHLYLLRNPDKLKTYYTSIS